MINLRTGLLPHQQAAFDKLKGLKIGALYMEMGTGKTRTTLQIIDHRLERGKIKHVLWLCPCSVKKNLKDDITKHAGNALPYIAIHGIESLSSSIRLFELLKKYVSAAATMIVVDESNLVKNFHAIRTQRIIELAAKCKYRVILNGTPIARNEADLFAQWYVLDWRVLGYRSAYRFAANHLEFDDYGRVRRCLNTSYLTEKIAPYTYQVSKEECLKLPEKNYVYRGYVLTDKQQEHYDEITEHMIDMLDDARPETVYRMFSAAQAVISGMWVEVGRHLTTYPMFKNPMDNPRIWKLLDILKEIGNEKVIIFCKYSHEIKTILGLFPNSVGFYGEMNQKQRLQSLERFRSDAQYLVANKTCAGYGLNLQYCKNVVFYSNDWDWATRAQAEDRVHRLGQMSDVTLYDICAEYTLDRKILQCLHKKESLNDSVKREINKNNSVTQAKGRFRSWLKGELDDGKKRN